MPRSLHEEQDGKKRARRRKNAIRALNGVRSTFDLASTLAASARHEGLSYAAKALAVTCQIAVSVLESHHR
ncbi:hypothetical protein Pme01_61180 [Planosporangium mesophilum]|uniref:Uncharacterized protein n=1 Tax=Planosporangium mesophilum TaxID=689768 RepID=A0A8J3TIW7_9ACTN|nr:hypothetical protein Pme01_61180 [Planosporangium mesophilum]